MGWNARPPLDRRSVRDVGCGAGLAVDLVRRSDRRGERLALRAVPRCRRQVIRMELRLEVREHVARGGADRPCSRERRHVRGPR
jgi:hypothetical protein